MGHCHRQSKSRPGRAAQRRAPSGTWLRRSEQQRSCPGPGPSACGVPCSHWVACRGSQPCPAQGHPPRLPEGKLEARRVQTTQLAGSRHTTETCNLQLQNPKISTTTVSTAPDDTCLPFPANAVPYFTLPCDLPQRGSIRTHSSVASTCKNPSQTFPASE